MDMVGVITIYDRFNDHWRETSKSLPVDNKKSSMLVKSVYTYPRRGGGVCAQLRRSCSDQGHKVIP